MPFPPRHGAPCAAEPASMLAAMPSCAGPSPWLFWCRPGKLLAPIHLGDTRAPHAQAGCLAAGANSPAQHLSRQRHAMAACAIARLDHAAAELLALSGHRPEARSIQAEPAATLGPLPVRRFFSRPHTATREFAGCQQTCAFALAASALPFLSP
ncbi:hypothetical protein GQ54DRAFT_53093 [Martensiomyces pterosporus]|nr:hypothetical protein GQ54DRAFT_53093 [Martensiomyces pterosporus]